jgi:hypothetical protein
MAVLAPRKRNRMAVVAAGALRRQVQTVSQQRAVEMVVQERHQQ